MTLYFSPCVAFTYDRASLSLLETMQQRIFLNALATTYKEQIMIQGQSGSPDQQQSFLISQRSHLLRKYPILLPFALLSGSIGLFVSSSFADAFLPILALIGVPASLLCVILALVLGISGLLASIISIIEGVDRHRLKAAMFAKTKEQSYGN